MKKKVTLIAVVALLVILAGVYMWRPSSAPPGQEPLTILSAANVSEFAAAFDADSDAPRMVLLLSPT